MFMNVTTKTLQDPRPYALGYSESEFRRLERQAAFFRDLTEEVLRRAGLAPGMHVLDVGCGVGDVSLLAGTLVGPTGAVLGIDRSAEAVDTARRRAAATGQAWVRFAAVELDAFSTEQKFDAVVGRLVLMYQPDPVATLRQLRRHLHRDGIIAFQEMAMPLARSVPDAPHFRQCSDWILAAFARAGFEVDMGGKLFATFLAAGLPMPQMIAAGRVEGGPHSPVYDFYAGVLRSLLPTIKRVGVATATDIEIDSMAERLRKEAIEHDACIMPPPLLGAWTRVPE
jgi:2-polyprenyl-3-methyl-5-hydroxy-6-metoxy-1,4-benzoquinol methylase